MSSKSIFVSPTGSFPHPVVESKWFPFMDFEYRFQKEPHVLFVGYVFMSQACFRGLGLV